MLKGIIKYRPTTLYAVYVEPLRIEVLRAHRKWRTWEIGPVEQHHVAEGDSVFDALQHLNLKVKEKGSALLLLLSSTYYTMHREHYPLSIKEQLDEAINFDWQENIFLEDDRTLHFSGPPTPIDQYVSVPIFSIQTEIYEKFRQALNGSLFHTFTVMPSALAFRSFLPSLAGPGDDYPLRIVARTLDGSHLEVHRFYFDSYLDTILVAKGVHSARLLREILRCGGSPEDPADSPARIDLLCSEEECAREADHRGDWIEEGLPVEVRELNGSFTLNWVEHLLKEEAIYTFDTELLLKPWEIPRVAWPLLALVVLFASYALYQVHAADSLTSTSKKLRLEASQLETQWKPIEAMQTRITKFSEDQKTLSAFSLEGYPLLELLTFFTQATPEDTYLNYLSLRKGQLIIRGESKSAIKYLSELSKIEGLSDVKFASPVTRNPASDQERFNVQLQLDIEKLRKNFENLPIEGTEETRIPMMPANGKQGPQEQISGENAEEPPEEAAEEEEAGPEEPEPVPEEEEQ
ncbi:MAG: PilN domain-containing protein [Desulfobacteraceae bacterium]|nr:PilN domain-containing protein [Desulfobacteraceae bacterium]